MTPAISKTLAVVPLLALLGLSACVSVPPEAHAPVRLAEPASRLPADLAASASAAWPAQPWWQRWGDAQLDGLVEQALRDSPSLQAAAARIQAAQAELTQRRAATQAGAALEVGANRQHYSANGLFPPPIGGETYNDFSVQLQGRLPLDLWGRQRAQVAAAVGEEAARRAEYAQARQLLAAAVVQTYWTLQTDWALQAQVTEQVGLQQNLLDDQQRRLTRGLVARDGLLQARQHLAQLRGQQAELGAQALRSREALRALLGTPAAAGPDALAALQPHALPAVAAGAPATLGYELLARRADLQAARWRVEASLSRVEAAQAAFYPSLDLSASLGLDSLTLPQLLRSASRTLMLGPTLSLPVFNGAALRGQLGEARSTRDELIADYDQRLLDAVRDVAQDLATLQGLAAQREQQQASLQAAAAQQQQVQRRLDQGLADRASLWQARLAWQREQQALLQLAGRQLQAEIELTRALGGGFHAEPAASPTQS